LLLPAVLAVVPATTVETWWVVDLPLVLGATGSLGLFYGATERSQGRSWLGALLCLPAVIALGAGLSTQLTLAVNEAFGSSSGEFVRTPKRGDRSASCGGWRFPLVELGLALVSGFSALLALVSGHLFAAPFAALFCGGHLAVALLDVRERLRAAGPPFHGTMAAEASNEPTTPLAALAARADRAPALDLRRREQGRRSC
ncbi:MAG: hypothetical protein JRI55_34290, partial [Deltaproteobacteria bacterium]|nr:hypothetical protein [Deltaproteobacteria bacterium]